MATLSKCYTCKYRRTIPWNTHSRCANLNANIIGNDHGVKNGWFHWPINFDPTWLITCNGWMDAHAKDDTDDVNPMEVV